MGRLIDADTLKEYAFFHEVDNVSYVEEEDIDKAPTVDAVERKRGRWVYGESEQGNDGYVCTKCGNFVPWIYKEFDIDFIKEFHFCPNCGAEMRGGTDDVPKTD